jgi:hypothetical protein
MMDVDAELKSSEGHSNGRSVSVSALLSSVSTCLTTGLRTLGCKPAVCGLWCPKGEGRCPCYHAATSGCHLCPCRHGCGCGRSWLMAVAQATVAQHVAWCLM